MLLFAPVSYLSSFCSRRQITASFFYKCLHFLISQAAWQLELFSKKMYECLQEQSSQKIQQSLQFYFYLPNSLNSRRRSATSFKSCKQKSSFIRNPKSSLPFLFRVLITIFKVRLQSSGSSSSQSFPPFSNGFDYHFTIVYLHPTSLNIKRLFHVT